MKIIYRNTPLKCHKNQYMIHTLPATYALHSETDAFFEKTYQLSKKLYWVGHNYCPDCIRVEGVFIVVAAEKEGKLTAYKGALQLLRKKILQNDVTKVCISSHDRLLKEKKEVVLPYSEPPRPNRRFRRGMRTKQCSKFICKRGTLLDDLCITCLTFLSFLIYST